MLIYIYYDRRDHTILGAFKEPQSLLDMDDETMLHQEYLR